MPPGKMHPDEIGIDVTLVRRLLAEQFPKWAHLAVDGVASAGTDNALFRLGSDMVVRLPRIPAVIGQVEKEFRWLPILAPHLPLAIPVPLAKGSPGDGYPWHWSIYRWLDGESVTVGGLADPHQAAKDLAHFIAALRRIDTTGGPLYGSQNFHRGAPLADRDQDTRAAIASLRGTLDTEAITRAWKTALGAVPWSEPHVWVHGDLQSGNLLLKAGRLSAVIDFGCLGVGDPACDLQIAWNLFSAETRAVFRTALEVDDATWARGRGWALSVGLIALPYYRKTNPALAGIAQYAIGQVLADQAGFS